MTCDLMLQMCSASSMQARSNLSSHSAASPLAPPVAFGYHRHVAGYHSSLLRRLIALIHSEEVGQTGMFLVHLPMLS